MSYKFIIHTDGGARGNPGPAAVGIVIEGGSLGRKEYGEYIGEATNNIAEYQAVIFALKKIKALIGSEQAAESSLEFRVDSELIAKQLNGKYKVKDKGLQELFMEIWNLRLDFREVKFNHLFREENRDSDRLVNQALDHEESRLNI